MATRVTPTSTRLPAPSHPSPADALVVRTRFVPPKLRPGLVHRARVEAVLARARDYPLTVVKAEAGYGKTTAVAAWAASAGLPYVWFNVGDTEPDPRVFLLHLVHALRALDPDIGARALDRLAHDDRSPRSWNAAVDALSNDLLDRLPGDTVLVLDDYDRVNGAEVNAVTERLVEAMPPQLHLVITARAMPSLRSRAKWRASGELLEVTRADLAFTAEEVASLLAARLGRPLSAEAAHSVTAETEGWPIALQMLGDSLGDAHPEALDHLLRRIPGRAELLFDYLAEEVFLRQPAETRRFLGESACLRRLDPGACDHALETPDTASRLRDLEQRSVFVTFDGAYRYHNLFADFLLRRADVPAERRERIHLRAAEYWRTHGDEEEAVHHLLAAGERDTAAAALGRIAGQMARSGRHLALAAWLDRLTSDELARFPELLLARGETLRLASRYLEALPAYRKARAKFRAMGDAHGEIRAIRGEVLVYLDTVQPALAGPLLREALRLTRGDRAERTAFFHLLAENTLNAGDLRRAERRYAAARRYAPAGEAPPPDPRILVRRGRFAEARAMVDASRRAEAPVAARPRAPRSHRESTALLAWLSALLGEPEAARQYAEDSLETGRALGAPTVECISLGRLAFGWLTGHDFDTVRARALAGESLRLAERIAVPRFRVEPLLALTIVSGLEGRREEAETAALEAIAILDAAGDRYLRNILCAALGGALVLCDHASAEEWLREAEREAIACGDRHVPCVAALWLAQFHARGGRTAQARECFARALAIVGAEGYAFLLGGASLLAPHDATPWRGMLRRAQEHAELGPVARELARALDPAAEPAAGGAGAPAESPATAPLYLQTLGPFRAWRAGQEIERSAWGREKALHLLQLLVCARGKALHREEILETLWSDSAPSTAATGLRVALSALRHALDPERASGAESAFVVREGETIRLASEAGIRVDADEFARLLKAARAAEPHDADGAIALYESALSLYRGEFLGENRYAGWADAERQRRRGEFLSSAERLAALLLAAGETDRAARWAETMLQHDPLWEAAYAVLMEAYWKQGNRALAVRTYKRCQKRLHAALGVAPSGKTTALMARIAKNEG